MENGYREKGLIDSERVAGSRGPKQQHRFVTGLLIIAVLLPAVLAFWVLHQEKFSVPYQDDFGDIVDFANDYSQLHGFITKLLYTATKQNNDYKLAFLHFIVAMQIELTGHLDFPLLVALGNSSLLAIAYMLWSVYRSEDDDLNLRLIKFIPISLLFWSLSYWESLDWAMAGLQNLPVILFSLLAISFFASRPSTLSALTRLLLGCISAILAALTSANGFLLAPVGLWFFWRRRSFTACAVWCTAFVLPVVAYMYHYTPFYVSVNIMHRSYIAKAFYFFAITGGVIPQRFVAAFLGFVICGVLGVAVFSRFEQTNPVPFYSNLWILLTVGLVAWLRQSLAPRYSIYSLLLLISCYWFLAQYLSTQPTSLNRKRLYVAGLVLAALCCLANDRRAYVRLAQRRQMVLEGMAHYQINPEVNSPTIDPEVAKYYPQELAFERNTLNRAIQLKVYALPPSH